MQEFHYVYLIQVHTDNDFRNCWRIRDNHNSKIVIRVLNFLVKTTVNLIVRINQLNDILANQKMNQFHEKKFRETLTNHEFIAKGLGLVSQTS